MVVALWTVTQSVLFAMVIIFFVLIPQIYLFWVGEGIRSYDGGITRMCCGLWQK